MDVCVFLCCAVMFRYGMGSSPVQRVLSKRLNGVIVSEDISQTEQARDVIRVPCKQDSNQQISNDIRSSDMVQMLPRSDSV